MNSEIQKFLFACSAPGGSPKDAKRLKELLKEVPGLESILFAAELKIHGVITEDDAVILDDLLEDLVDIIIRARRGDGFADNQLCAIEKLIYPDNFLPEKIKKVIDKLADSYHTSPALARGWRVRRIMLELAAVVVPARSDADSALDGPIRLNRERRTWEPYKKAEENWKRGTTLQSLAIRVYLKELQDDGIEWEFDESSLLRDLRAVEKWDKEHPQPEWAAEAIEKAKESLALKGIREPLSWRLPIKSEYSEGWKQRGKRKGDKKVSAKGWQKFPIFDKTQIPYASIFSPLTEQVSGLNLFQSERSEFQTIWLETKGTRPRRSWRCDSGQARRRSTIGLGRAGFQPTAFSASAKKFSSI